MKSIRSNRGWEMFVAIAVPIILVPVAQAATYSGGSGTEADPYQIGNAADWTTLAAAPGDWNKNFILIADIDFGGASLPYVAPDTFPLDGGFTGVPFTGVFDGNGHLLQNGQITPGESECVGPFGFLGMGGEIRNLGIEAVTVSAGYTIAGGLVGTVQSGTITSCYATGNVSAMDEVGGLVGINNCGKIISCYATGTTYCYADAGGLVGRNNGGTITSCYATGAASGTADIGGLVGYNDGGKIISCYAIGAASCGWMGAGGLVGANNGVVTSCYSKGTVTGGSSIGGLVGFNAGTVTLSYWDIDTSGILTSASGEGRTTDDMTYPYAVNTYQGWDFTEVWAEDTGYTVNAGYPYLIGYILPPVEGECEFEGEREGEGEGEVAMEGEGEVTAEGEGEVPAEGEGEVPVEGEGELPAEGEGEAEVCIENPEGCPKPFMGGVYAAGQDLCLCVPCPVSGASTYAWMKDGEALSNGGRISGADARTLQIVMLELSDSGLYSCIYDDGTKAAAVFHTQVTVAPAIPALSPLGLIALTIVCAALGIFARKRKA